MLCAHNELVRVTVFLEHTSSTRGGYMHSEGGSGGHGKGKTDGRSQSRTRNHNTRNNNDSNGNRHTNVKSKDEGSALGSSSCNGGEAGRKDGNTATDQHGGDSDGDGGGGGESLVKRVMLKFCALYGSTLRSMHAQLQEIALKDNSAYDHSLMPAFKGFDSYTTQLAAQQPSSSSASHSLSSRHLSVGGVGVLGAYGSNEKKKKQQRQRSVIRSRSSIYSRSAPGSVVSPA